jgi:hypothetical protein
LTLCKLQPQQSRLPLSQDRKERAGVYVHPQLFPSLGTMHADGNDGARHASIEAIRGRLQRARKVLRPGDAKDRGDETGMFLTRFSLKRDRIVPDK